MPLYKKLQELIEKVEQALRNKGKTPGIAFEWIPREENEEADSLSKHAYEQFCISHPEVLRRYVRYLATEKQIELMKRLKIPVFYDISKFEASRLINKRLRELNARF